MQISSSSALISLRIVSCVHLFPLSSPTPSISHLSQDTDVRYVLSPFSFSSCSLSLRSLFLFHSSLSLKPISVVLFRSHISLSLFPYILLTRSFTCIPLPFLSIFSSLPLSYSSHISQRNSDFSYRSLPATDRWCEFRTRRCDGVHWREKVRDHGTRVRPAVCVQSE